MTVYLDLVMGLNFLVDLLLLLGTNRLAGFPIGLGRCAGAALLGSLYSGACLLPEFRFLGSSLWRIVSLGLMGMLAFGFNKAALQRCGVFLILSMALGGLAMCMGSAGFLPLVCCGAALLGLCNLSFRNGIGRNEYIPVTLCHGSRCVSLLALRDTGNTLRDPITGEQVLVLSTQAAVHLTGLTPQQLRTPLETLSQKPLPGLRLIPYRTVGSGGMLLGMRVDQAKIGEKKQSVVAAFALEDFGMGEVYQALTGGIV